MNTIVILSLFALITLGLALIHETRLRRAAAKMFRRLVMSRWQDRQGRDRK
jgi:hypothetical protein